MSNKPETAASPVTPTVVGGHAATSSHDALAQNETPRPELNPTPTGVVLDEPMAHALLWAACREGLVDNDPAFGDGFVRKLLDSPPPPQLVADAYEHLVMGGQVFIPFWLPPRWQGALFDEGTILPTYAGTEEELVEVSGLSPSLMLAMLHDRGQPWTEEQLLARYTAFKDAYSAWEVAGGRSFEGMQLRMALKGLRPIEPEEFPQGQVALWQAASAAYDALRPVLDCLSGYRRVLTSSLQNGALSALPLQSTVISPAELPLTETSADRIALLRVTCKTLLRTPIGIDLRQTVSLARSPEAQHLRTKLTAWTEVIRKNDADPVPLVMDEVERARRALKTAKTLARIGEYSTIIGVPVAIAGAFVTGPLVGIGGAILAVSGGVVLAAQKHKEHLNRWAMFGQV
jgi:hypothetical protein